MAYQTTVEEEIHQSTDHDQVDWMDLGQMDDYFVAPAEVPLLQCQGRDA